MTARLRAGLRLVGARVAEPGEAVPSAPVAVPSLAHPELEALGRLTAELLHELSHPLQCLIECELDLQDACDALDASATGRTPPLPATDDLRDVVDRMSQANAQALAIVRAGRVFLHPGSPEPVGCDINHLVESAVTLARYRIRRAGSVRVALGAVPTVRGEPGALTRAFVNLLLNAADAVAETATPGAPGQVHVRTWQDRDHVVVSISDTGPGIPEVHRGSIFDAFFTTKAPGLGTGQGLTITRTIVEEQHGGALTYETEVGAGTTFHVRFPSAGGPAT